MAKTVRRLSNITTLRGNTTSSPDVARNFMNFHFNHSQQRNVRPTRLGSCEGWTTPNPSGGPAVSNDAGTGRAMGEDGVANGFTMPPNDPGNTKV